MLSGRFAFANRQAPWGPGRVDTFNFAKAIFNFPAEKLAPAELAGVSDFPSIWLQRPRKARTCSCTGTATTARSRSAT